jgi:3-mercaptopyruvate sulfurtransferase SseA
MIGVGNDKPIVCYDRQDNKWATRVAFILATYNFNDVKVLDGGL